MLVLEVGKIVHYKEKMTKEEQKQEILEYANKVEEVLSDLETIKNNCRNRIINGKYTLNNMVEEFEDIFDKLKSNKNNNSLIDGKIIYELALESNYKEHYYNTKNYLESKFGIDYDNEDKPMTIKRKIKLYFYGICENYNIVKEVKNIMNIAYQVYYLTIGLIKYILLHLIYLFKFLIPLIPSVINIIIKYLKAKIK